MSSGVKKSGAPCGPYSTPISHSFEYSRHQPRRQSLRRRRCSLPTCSTSPLRSTRPRVPAELPEDESAPAAQILRHIDAAGHRQVRRDCPRPAPAPSSSTEPARTATAFQRGTGAPSSFAPKSAPSSAIAVSQSKRSVGPVTVISSPARLLRISHQPVRQPERQPVHRPRGRHADVPVAQPPGVVLHRRLRAGRRALRSPAAVLEASQERRRDPALGELRMRAHLPQIARDSFRSAADRGPVSAVRSLRSGARRDPSPAR